MDKAIIEKAVEDLARPTKVNPRNTKAWEKFADFETFLDPQIERMKEAAVGFTDELMQDRNPRWLSLLGTSGAGKTMLTKRIANLYREHRHERINWPASRADQSRLIRFRGGFINWGRAVNDRMLKGNYDFLADMQDYSFFAIDDIISEYEKHRSLSASKLYGVLESRLGKWTVITANASLEQIGELLDPRISSRMIRGGSQVIDVDVPDYNMRQL